MDKIKLADKLIGEGEPCFIIAEVGSNHDGSLETAKTLIKIAKNAGADAVKFQTFKAEKKVSKRMLPRMFNVLKRYELKTEWHPELKGLADKLGIPFLSTPFDEESVDLLDDMDIPAFKVASSDLTHLPLLRHIAKKAKPVILSTGGANLAEVEEAISAIKNEENEKIILLHCVMDYPAKTEDANIQAMITLRDAFHLPAGYSDHSLGTIVSLAAIAIGASIIEKHFSLDRSLPGPDHPFALEPDELKQMIRNIRLLERALGDGIKRMTANERNIVPIGRRSLIASRDIPKGTTLSREMIKILRPAKGIAPKHLDLVLGRKAKIDIPEGEPIRWEAI